MLDAGIYNAPALPLVQYRLDHIRRQQREPEQARDVGRVDRLGHSQFLDCAIAAQRIAAVPEPLPKTSGAN